jgi:dimethylaniline monooxygenase (N-oxide forming)
MARYFRAYAERFDLIRRIRFKSPVTAIEPSDECFTVRIAGGAADVFDGVVVAAGHQSIPRHPPQAAGFDGEYLHSHAYRIPETYAGKRVLIIGLGNSGADIAADICTVAEKTILWVRSPVLIMPRMMFGMPIPRILVRLERPFLPWKVRIWIRTMLTRVFHGRMEQ